MFRNVSKHPASDVAFTPSVKAEQTRHGSRRAYARMEDGEGWETTVTDELRAFLAARDSVYLATTNAEGQPYIQHRGGPKGFVRILDDHTLAFLDYSGNRQYVTVGNLADNDRAFLFAMNYTDRERVKIWGRARVVEGDAALVEKLGPAPDGARIERVIVFEIAAWDVNCPRHIPRKFDEEDVAATISGLKARISALEEENARLRRDP